MFDEILAVFVSHVKNVVNAGIPSGCNARFVRESMRYRDTCWRLGIAVACLFVFVHMVTRTVSFRSHIYSLHERG